MRARPQPGATFIWTIILRSPSGLLRLTGSAGTIGAAWRALREAAAGQSWAVLSLSRTRA